mmetsp:Transcript_27684/g.51129  ORF Transcript_27684/g.51129 Transcript_27684/m.51129 type:complete len:217 (+) Transcript_27684:71-721(+)
MPPRPPPISASGRVSPRATAKASSTAPCGMACTAASKQCTARRRASSWLARVVKATWRERRMANDGSTRHAAWISPGPTVSLPTPVVELGAGDGDEDGGESEGEGEGEEEGEKEEKDEVLKNEEEEVFRLLPSAFVLLKTPLSVLLLVLLLINLLLLLLIPPSPTTPLTSIPSAAARGSIHTRSLSVSARHRRIRILAPSAVADSGRLKGEGEGVE